MIRILTIFALFAASSASAEDAANITLRLTPAEVIALQRSLDRQPISQTPPAGFWSLQVKLSHAVEGSPETKRAVQAATK